MRKTDIENKAIDTDIPAALAIVARGMVSPSEMPTLQAAGAAIWDRGGPRSQAEQMVCRFVENTTLILPSPIPRPPDPPAMLDAIEAAAVTFAEMKAISDAKLDVMVIARRENQRKPSEKNATAAKEAEQAYIDARSAMERASSIVTRRRNQLEAWRWQQVANEPRHGERKS